MGGGSSGSSTVNGLVLSTKEQIQDVRKVITSTKLKDVHIQNPLMTKSASALQTRLDASGFEDEEILMRKAKEKFDSLDVDKNGELDRQEMMTLIEWILSEHEHYGLRSTVFDKSSVAEKLLSAIDVNHDSQIGFDEFVYLFDEVCLRVQLMSKAKAKFNDLDIDQSGVLESSKLVAVANWLLTSLEKVGLSQDQQNILVDQLVSRVDLNNDKKLDIYEFSLLFDYLTSKVCLMNKARSLFDELDYDMKGYLDKENIEKLAEKLLMMYNFHPNGAAVDKDEKRSMVSKLLRRLDTCGSTVIDLHIFSGIFEEVSDLILMTAMAKEKFEQLDTDKNGELKDVEMEEVMRWALSAFSTVISNGDLQENVLNAVKILRNEGTILNFQEFLQLFIDVSNKLKAMNRAKQKFDERDINHDGYIVPEELPAVVDWMLNVYSMGGEYISIEVKKEMSHDILSTMDIDKDGKLSMLEFAALFDQVERKRRARRSSLHRVQL